MREKALSKRAFMRDAGMSFPTIKKLWADPTFPTVAGKVFWSDFVLWRRRNLRSPHPPIEQGLEPGACHTTGESVPTSDLLTALPPRAARLAASLR